MPKACQGKLLTQTILFTPEHRHAGTLMTDFLWEIFIWNHHSDLASIVIATQRVKMSKFGGKGQLENNIGR